MILRRFLLRAAPALALSATLTLAMGGHAFADTWTDLRYAVYNGNTEEVARLLNGGADINMQNEEGWTALEVAAEQDNVAMVKFLLAHGADPKIKDNRHRGPVDVTTSVEVKRLLGWTPPAKKSPSTSPAASSKSATAAPKSNHCKTMYGKTYKLCDSSDYSCKIKATQDYQNCLKKGTWY